MVDAYGSPLDRELLDTVVFAIDDKFLKSLRPKPQSKDSVAKAWSGFVAMVNGDD